MKFSLLRDSLACVDDAFESETRLRFVIERLRHELGGWRTKRYAGDGTSLAEQVRAFLDERLFERVTLAEVATHVGVDPTRVARAFARAFGIPPHRYVLGRRLDAARDRILGGAALAEVATEVGFVDQAHLTRRFRHFLGTTPGRFAFSARGSPGPRRDVLNVREA